MAADESTLDLLRGFAESKSEWKPEFDQILLRIADTCYTEGIPWQSLRELIRYKIKKNIHSDEKLARANGLQSINNGETVTEYEERIDEGLDSFDEPPFTIQRLCELVTNPIEHHRNIWAYLRALEKVLLVTSSDDVEHLHPHSTTTTNTTRPDAMIMSPSPVDPLPAQVVALGSNPVPSPFAPILRPATPPANVGGSAPDPAAIASGIVQQHGVDDPMDTD